MSSPHRYFRREPSRCWSRTPSQNRRLLLAPCHRGGVRLVAGALVTGKYLRIHETVAEIAVEAGIEPVHHLVDPCALAQVLGIGGRVDLVGEILEDRRALGQAEVAVLEHRHQPARIDRRVRRLHVLAGHQVDDLVLERDAVVGGEQHDRTADRGDGVVIELHNGRPSWLDRDPWNCTAAAGSLPAPPHRPRSRPAGAETGGGSGNGTR